METNLSRERSERLLTPAEFTQAHVTAWHEKHPDVKMEALSDLEVRAVGPEPRQTSMQRSYEIYVHEPERLAELIGRFVRGQAESLAKPAQSVAAALVVPVIKTRKWLAARQEPPMVYEDLSSDLIIVYAQDFPDTIRYLRPPDLEPAGLTRESLRPLAVKNLLERLETKHHIYRYCCMLTAGGDYEASLILADSILQDYQSKVKGSLVIALPSAVLFLLTGSDDSEGLAFLKEEIARQREQGTLLTSRLFLYKDGTLTEMPSEE